MELFEQIRRDQWAEGSSIRELFAGRDAYFADPEGNYWEIAWASADNPVTVAARRAAGIL